VREWLERVVADPVPVPVAARARALNELALILSDDVRRDGERIDRLMREATSIASAVGDVGELAACDLAQVEVVLARGRVTEAKSLTEAALGIYERLQLPAGIGWCHYFLAWIAVAEDDPVRGRAHFERALDVARSTPGAEWLMPHALAGLAAVVAWLGRDRQLAKRTREQLVATVNSMSEEMSQLRRKLTEARSRDPHEWLETYRQLADRHAAINHVRNGLARTAEPLHETFLLLAKYHEDLYPQHGHTHLLEARRMARIAALLNPAHKESIEQLALVLAQLPAWGTDQFRADLVLLDQVLDDSDIDRWTSAG